MPVWVVLDALPGHVTSAGGEEALRRTDGCSCEELFQSATEAHPALL